MSHVLISGGTRGIGSAVANKFLCNGYKVTCLYSSNDIAANNFRESCMVFSDSLNVKKCDVSSPKEVKKCVEESKRLFGSVDIVVSNAGISFVGLADTFTFDDYRRIMDTNFGGFFNLTNSVISDMVHNKSGVIIAISSMWGQVGASCEALYSASKGAIDAYVKSLAKELGPSGIRVNAVSPGVVKTDMLNCYSEEDLAELADETPLGKVGSPEEIANMVYFLTTNEASFVTGQVIGVNGGFLI